MVPASGDPLLGGRRTNTKGGDRDTDATSRQTAGAADADDDAGTRSKKSELPATASPLQRRAVLVAIFLAAAVLFGTCWLLLPPPIYPWMIPAPRKAHFSGLLHDRLFVFSGRGAHKAVLTDLWSYDFYENKWSRHRQQGERKYRSCESDVFIRSAEVEETVRRRGESVDERGPPPKAAQLRPPAREVPEEGSRQPARRKPAFTSEGALQLQLERTSSLEAEKNEEEHPEGERGKLPEDHDVATSALVHLDVEGLDFDSHPAAKRSHPSGRFNGCHVSTKHGLLVYGGDEKFYGTGRPDPDLMSRELWLLSATNHLQKPRWKWLGPLTWDFPSRDVAVAQGEGGHGSFTKNAAPPPPPAAPAAHEPHIATSSTTSHSESDSGDSIPRTSNETSTTEVRVRTRVERLVRQHKVRKRLGYTVERSAPACAFDGFEEKFYFVGGRPGVGAPDNILWVIDLKAFLTGGDRGLSDLVGRQVPVEGDVRPLPVKGGCGGSPHAFTKSVADELEKQAGAAGEQTAAASSASIRDAAGGRAPSGVAAQLRGPPDDVGANTTVIVVNKSRTKTVTTEKDEAGRVLGRVVVVNKTISSSSTSTPAAQELVNQTGTRRPQQVGPFANRTIMYLHGGRKGNQYSDQLLALVQTPDRKLRWEPRSGEYLEREVGKTIFRTVSSTLPLPPARNHHACVYVPEHQSFWIFGGRSNHRGANLALRDDLWGWEGEGRKVGGTWRQRTPDRGKVLDRGIQRAWGNKGMIKGQQEDEQGLVTDRRDHLWPSARFLPTLEYVVREDRFLIFGGQDERQKTNDVWLIGRTEKEGVTLLQGCEYCE